MNNIEIECSYCKGIKSIPQWKHTYAQKHNRKLFCSMDCSKLYRKYIWRKNIVKCTHCGKDKNVPPGMYNHQLRNDPNKNTWFCNIKCYHLFKAKNSLQNTVECLCDYCKTPFQIMKMHLVKHKRHFCSRKCQGNYASKIYKFGDNRSKLETILETYIRTDFPTIKIICNDRDVCSPVELDFYFPDLSKAIEINGICHIEPIYGCNPLNRTIRNDSYKKIQCNKKNIQLLVVHKTLNQQKDNSLEIYNTLVKPFLQ